VSGGGKAKYDAKRHALVWKFKKFPGESEASLMASVDLIATTKEKRSWAKPPIQLQFHVRALPTRVLTDIRHHGVICRAGDACALGCTLSDGHQSMLRNSIPDSRRQAWLVAGCCIVFARGRGYAQRAAPTGIGYGVLSGISMPKKKFQAYACAQVPMYSASGLRVLYLRVWERGDYKVDKWVRKVARSGSYEIRA